MRNSLVFSKKQIKHPSSKRFLSSPAIFALTLFTGISENMQYFLCLLIYVLETFPFSIFPVLFFLAQDGSWLPIYLVLWVSIPRWEIKLLLILSCYCKVQLSIIGSNFLQVIYLVFILRLNPKQPKFLFWWFS